MSRARGGLGFWLVVVGLFLRVWLSLISDNADARTLTWGAAFLATDPTRDPWLATASHSLGDPIPLNNTRALSLATGPIPVVSGAVMLAAADLVGLVELGERDELDGRTMAHTTITVHRLSYLIPEVLLLLILRRLGKHQGNWHTLLFVWATTPLAVFTWGQGMPDTWTIAVLLGGWLAVEEARAADVDRRRLMFYGLALLAGTVGALWTKLFPVIVLPSVVLAIATDERVGGRGRRHLAAVGFGGLFLGFLPFLFSKAMWVSMFIRFEFDMLQDSSTVKVVSSVPEAGFALIAMAAAVTWGVASRRQPSLDRAETMLIALVLASILLSGMISHLLFWTLPAVFLVARRHQPAGLFLHAALGVLTLLHVVWYDWLDGMLIDTIAPTFKHDAPWNTIERVVPMANLLSSLISAAALVAAAVAVIVGVRGGDDGRRPDGVGRRHLLIAMAAPVLTVAALGLAAVAGAETGVASANVRSEFWDANQPRNPGEVLPVTGVLLLARGDAWTSPALLGGGPADRVYLAIDKGTQFSTDLLRVELVDSDGRVWGRGEMPVWEAEPKSERWPTSIALDRRVDEIRGLSARVQRVAAGEGPATAQLGLPALTVQRIGTDGVIGRPIWGIEMEFRDGQGREVLGPVLRGVLAPWRLALSAGLALGMSALGAFVLRDRVRAANRVSRIG